MRNTIFLFILLTIVTGINLKAQDTPTIPTANILQYEIVNGDTLYLAQIKEVYILPKREFTSNAERRKYGKLARNVKKVYPYSLLAGQKYREVTEHLATLKTEKEKKEYMKIVEQEIVKNFEEDLKGLTITQGRILLKLIDRETGETSYELVKEFRGSFSAVFWQTLARVFGNNLKSEYDADGEDILINEIVLLIENGQL